ncbi:MAG: thiamine-phosphate kinase [Candidatus Altiarchaeota archaeon]
MTSISDIGGEFSLIRRVTRQADDKNVVMSVGDDTAVLEYTEDDYLLFTTDMMVEGDHFNTGWSTPRQIGVKAMESNVSDIAAMGGRPKYALISLTLTKDTSVEFVEQLYDGMYSVCGEYGFNIVGGDTTHGSCVVINVAMIGLVGKRLLRLRSGARVGDVICVTGDIGKSKAGLEMLLHGFKGDYAEHTEPKCRLKEAWKIAEHANAMIDVSDGLASEVNHICAASGVGALVYKSKIPVSDKTREYAGKCGGDPIDYALNGGEDYELLFTLPKGLICKIDVSVPLTVVGEIVDEGEGVMIVNGGGKKVLKGGFNHFQ